MFPNYNKISFYLNKYRKKDPWDLVELFEKKIANYSGSKYAVSTDCCTNAIFLCLKYSKKKKFFFNYSRKNLCFSHECNKNGRIQN